MLKIKDSVDLKELEKFGYAECYCDYDNYLKTIDLGKGKFWVTIKIYEKSRYIRIERIFGNYAVHNVEKQYKKYIKDLIQANLVEE